MWWWVLIFAVLGIAGFAVIGVLCWNLYGKVRQLGRTVTTAHEQISSLTAELEQITVAQDGGPLSRTGGLQAPRRHG